MQGKDSMLQGESEFPAQPFGAYRTEVAPGSDIVEEDFHAFHGSKHTSGGEVGKEFRASGI